MPTKKRAKSRTEYIDPTKAPTKADLARIERVWARLPVRDKAAVTEIVDELLLIVSDPKHVNYSPTAILRAICEELGHPLPCAPSGASGWVYRALARHGVQWGAA